MSNVPSTYVRMDSKDVEAKRPLSEYVMQKIGAALNFFRDRAAYLFAQDTALLGRISAWNARGVMLHGARVQDYTLNMVVYGGAQNFIPGSAVHIFLGTYSNNIDLVPFFVQSIIPTFTNSTNVRSFACDFSAAPAVFAFQCPVDASNIYVDTWQAVNV